MEVITKKRVNLLSREIIGAAIEVHKVLVFIFFYVFYVPYVVK